jgi:hypothetical protein
LPSIPAAQVDDEIGERNEQATADNIAENHRDQVARKATVLGSKHT